jgi:serine/threonine-protein kinase PknG
MEWPWATEERVVCRATWNCPGTVEEGYCNVCGKIARQPLAMPAPSFGSDSAAAGSGPAWWPTGNGSTRNGSTRTASFGRIGAGLLSMPAMPRLDPAAAVMAEPQVAESQRFCASCGAEVGRGREGRPGRPRGFCSKCRSSYSFLPALEPDELVAGQYRVCGCLAYGGLGWVYLAQDEQVSRRWVVLKGLLHSGDPEAMATALAERQFLARVEHPNVVRIYNFVEHAGAGYIVMEYVGGHTLKELLEERHRLHGRQAGALSVEHALAYILGILPAFAHLHRLGLLYNDFKPDNLMLCGDEVKLIDLGAVTHEGDAGAALYGTEGYRAPEVSSRGPSISSDLYTVGRTLAALLLELGSQHRESLPSPQEEPLLERQESLHRFLLKATAREPERRFQSAEEMAEQLLGVLREVVATAERSPRPAISNLFGGDLQALANGAGTGAGVAESTNWRQLPAPKVDPSDPAAGFLVNVAALNEPAQQLVLLAEAISQGLVPDSVETELGLARALIWAERLEEAGRHLEEVRWRAPGDWRATWYRGICLLAEEKPGEAQERFQEISSELPGELAPKLAEALAAELADNRERAARLYDVVSSTDPGFTSACFGLARVQAGLGRRAAAVEALRRIPETSSLHHAAQIALARTLVRSINGAQPGVTELVQASATLTRLDLNPQQRAPLAVELLQAALSLLDSRAVRPNREIEVLGRPLEKKALSLGLEEAYRQLARFAAGDEKIRLVDRANQARPLTWV